MEAEYFDQQGAAYQWDELSPKALAIRRKRGNDSTTILVAHGKLVASLTSSMAEGSVVDLGLDEMFVGTTLRYAYLHQTGTRTISVFGRGSAVLPERKFVHVSEEAVLRWARLVQRALGPGTKYGTAALEEFETLPELD